MRFLGKSSNSITYIIEDKLLNAKNVFDEIKGFMKEGNKIQLAFKKFENKEKFFFISSSVIDNKETLKKEISKFFDEDTISCLTFSILN